MEKPLFIPLATKHYVNFVTVQNGLVVKDTEYRLFGPRWNRKTCYPGRRVVISKGYGTHRRAMGYIDQVDIVRYQTLHFYLRESLKELYSFNQYDNPEIICIKIRDLEEMIVPDSRDC